MSIKHKIIYKIFIISVAAAFFILLIFLFWTNRLNVIYSLADDAKYFIGRPINWTYQKISNGIFLIKDAPHLDQEIKDLQLKNLELNNQLIESNLLKKENEQLRLQLGVRVINFIQPIFSTKAIGFSNFSDLILKGGSEDGFFADMIVFGAGNILVGKIIKTLNHQSFVQTIFNPENQIPVKVLPSNSFGFLRVDTFFNLKLELEKNSSKISEGDTVLTSGIDK